MDETSLGHMPGERWEFDQSVTDRFDDMLRRSIPQYDVMREAVLDLAVRHAAKGGLVLDLGCSRGDALAGVVTRLGPVCEYVGVEVSRPMVEAARARFSESPAPVTILAHDLRTGYPDLTSQAAVTLAVLTLQFVPINYRQQIVQDVQRRTRTGGAFIVVEKVLGAGADLDRGMVDLYHQHKRRGGYSEEEVERKRLALEGVLVPVTAAWNEELLRQAGFRHVDCFWRWMNFAGWIAVN